MDSDKSRVVVEQSNKTSESNTADIIQKQSKLLDDDADSSTAAPPVALRRRENFRPPQRPGAVACPGINGPGPANIDSSSSTEASQDEDSEVTSAHFSEILLEATLVTETDDSDSDIDLEEASGQAPIQRAKVYHAIAKAQIIDVHEHSPSPRRRKIYFCLFVVILVLGVAVGMLAVNKSSFFRKSSSAAENLVDPRKGGSGEMELPKGGRDSNDADEESVYHGDGGAEGSNGDEEDWVTPEPEDDERGTGGKSEPDEVDGGEGAS